MPGFPDIASTVLRAGVAAIGEQLRRRGPVPPAPGPPGGGPRPSPSPGPASGPPGDGYPGDYRGLPTLSYSPHPGRQADPGEVVWAWVPYEEDHAEGKDRPVLVIGRDGGWLLGLPLSSVDHDLDAAQEAAEHRFWVDLGPGDWDEQGRDSHVRVDRIVRLDPHAVRRIGGVVSRQVFDDVAAGLRRHWAD